MVVVVVIETKMEIEMQFVVLCNFEPSTATRISLANHHAITLTRLSFSFRFTLPFPSFPLHRFTQTKLYIYTYMRKCPSPSSLRPRMFPIQDLWSAPGFWCIHQLFSSNMQNSESCIKQRYDNFDTMSIICFYISHFFQLCDNYSIPNYLVII